MKTPEEIKKGLECCRNDAPCLECEYADLRNRRYTCEDALLSDALAYIRQLEDQIASLGKEPPMRHGQWKDTPIGIIKCSECGGGFNLVEMLAHYCPNCGAKMDLEVQDDHT